MSQTIFEPGSISLPLLGRIISPCLPTAHSMNVPGSGLPLASVALAASVVGLFLLQAGDGVMRDLAALHRARANLNRAHPARPR